MASRRQVIHESPEATWIPLQKVIKHDFMFNNNWY